MDQGKSGQVARFKDDKEFLEYMLEQERLAEKQRQYSYRLKTG